MMNLQPSQSITLEEFRQLPIKQRHAYTEKIMGDRIMLTYNQALTICRSVIDSDEKLSNAFQNFQKLKNEQSQKEVDEDLLRGVFVDKFKERIFFVIGNEDDNINFVYDIPSAQLLDYENSWNLDKILPDLSHIQMTELFIDHDETFENAWRNSTYIHQIKNDVGLNDNFSENQQYLSDNHYRSITKYFTPLNNIEEENYFMSPTKDKEGNNFRMFNSTSNPAHSTIDPDDLINHTMTSVKNARNV